jgi:thiamine biosynthesis lipoprotein
LTRDPRSGSVQVRAPLDLHGIGKGLALRWAWRRLGDLMPDARSGALLDAGGDLVGRAPGPAEHDWLIAIEDPNRAPEPIAVVTLAAGAIATSSVRLATWTDPSGNAAHHLIDPRSGAPGDAGLLAVTVAGPDPAWAEIRTKELFLAGAHDIAGLARRRDHAAWWVTTDGDLHMTAAARQRTRWP